MKNVILQLTYIDDVGSVWLAYCVVEVDLESMLCSNRAKSVTWADSELAFYGNGAACQNPVGFFTHR